MSEQQIKEWRKIYSWLVEQNRMRKWNRMYKLQLTLAERIVT